MVRAFVGRGRVVRMDAQYALVGIVRVHNNEFSLVQCPVSEGMELNQLGRVYIERDVLFQPYCFVPEIQL